MFQFSLVSLPSWETKSLIFSGIYCVQLKFHGDGISFSATPFLLIYNVVMHQMWLMSCLSSYSSLCKLKRLDVIFLCAFEIRVLMITGVTGHSCIPVTFYSKRWRPIYKLQTNPSIYYSILDVDTPCNQPCFFYYVEKINCQKNFPSRRLRCTTSNLLESY